MQIRPVVRRVRTPVNRVNWWVLKSFELFWAKYSYIRTHSYLGIVETLPTTNSISITITTSRSILMSYHPAVNGAMLIAGTGRTIMGKQWQGNPSWVVRYRIRYTDGIIILCCNFPKLLMDDREIEIDDTPILLPIPTYTIPSTPPTWLSSACATSPIIFYHLIHRKKWSK